VTTEAGFLGLLGPLVEAYAEVLETLAAARAAWVRLDEPALVEDRGDDDLAALRRAYERLGGSRDRPAIVVSTYFGHVRSAMPVLAELPVEGVGLDLCRGEEKLALLGDAGGLGDKVLFAAVVDGRNVWRADLEAALGLVEQLGDLAGEVVVSTSRSLLHVPLGLGSEVALDDEVRPWLAFAEEKLDELATLAPGGRPRGAGRWPTNWRPTGRRWRTAPPFSPPVWDCHPCPRPPSGRSTRPQRCAPPGPPGGPGRSTAPATRRCCGPRSTRSSPASPSATTWCATSPGSCRDSCCPQRVGSSPTARAAGGPVIFGDVARSAPVTLAWARYARSRTAKPVKGMLTGPITMLRWSFVRDDLPDAEVAAQLGLAMRDELVDLQSASVGVIQVDEPALREGLPLRAAEYPGYLAWATRAFRLVTSAAEPATQIHTHMCCARLGDIVAALGDIDVDVVSLEAARSKMAVVDELADIGYLGAVGRGVYDVHAPSVPGGAELEARLRRAVGALGPWRLWVNPDCGLKTRSYDEVVPALSHLLAAVRTLRAELASDGIPPQGEDRGHSSMAGPGRGPGEKADHGR